MSTPTKVNEAVPAALAEVSRSHANRGDVRSAQLALWTSDVYTLESLLWQNGLAQGPDPEAQLAAVGAAIATALEEVAAGDLDGVTPLEAVGLARDALIAAFEPSVHEVIRERLLGLEHLVGLPDSQEVAHQDPERLGGRTADQLVVELLAAAGDCMAVAQELSVVAENAAARRMARQADVASFEAYLIAAASLAGDHALESVELRWELAHTIDPGPVTSDGLAGELAERREQLLGLLGAAERGVLEQTFEAVPENFR